MFEYLGSLEKVEKEVNEPPKAMICLSYVVGSQITWKRILEQRKSVLTVMRPSPKKLVCPKDTISKMKRSDIVYCVPYEGCPADYIGETKRRLCKKIDKHRRPVQLGDFEVSAVAQHAFRSWD